MHSVARGITARRRGSYRWSRSAKSWMRRWICLPPAPSPRGSHGPAALGHANATDTYWYLEATPVLLNQVFAATERLHAGRGR